MAWDNWVIDATMGVPFCFCPIDGDLDGEHSIVIGINVLGGPPPGAKVIAVVHAEGQEAADAFYEKHKTEIDALVKR